MYLWQGRMWQPVFHIRTLYDFLVDVCSKRNFLELSISDKKYSIMCYRYLTELLLRSNKTIFKTLDLSIE